MINIFIDRLLFSFHIYNKMREEKQQHNSNQLVNRLFRNKRTQSIINSASHYVRNSAQPTYLVPKMVKTKLKPIETDLKSRSKVFSQMINSPTQIQQMNSYKNITELSIGRSYQITRVKSKVNSIMEDNQSMERQFEKIILKEDNNKDEYDDDQKGEKKHLTPNDFMEVMKIYDKISDQFCYMNKRQNSYDWQIVEFDKKNNDEYMIISKRGLTKYHHQEVQFINFQTFLQEQQQFQSLQKIQFFSIFTKYKNFQLWKKYTTFNVFKANLKKLQDNTLLQDINLKELLFQVHHYCANIQSINGFYTQTISSMPLQNFITYVQTQKHKTILKLVEIQNQIGKILAVKTAISMNLFMTKMRISKDNKLDKKIPLLIGDDSAKQMPFTQSATLRTHQTKIRNFFKLTDYLVIHSKTQFIINMITKLYQVLEQMNYLMELEKKSLISLSWIMVYISEKQSVLYYQPSREQLTEQIQQIILGTLGELCSKHYQYLHREQFDQYWKCSIEAEKSDEYIEIKSMIDSNKQFNEAIHKFRFQINRMFSGLGKYNEIFVRPLNFLKYIRDIRSTNFHEHSAQFFEQVLIKCRIQVKHLHQIETQRDVSILLVNSSNLKSIVEKEVQALNNKIHQFIPDILYQRSLKMLSDIQKGYILIQYNPSEIKEYILFRRNTTKVSLLMEEELFILVNQNSQLLGVSENFSINVNPKIKTSIGQANGQIIGLKRRLDQIYKKEEELMQKFVKKIQKLVPTFSERVKEHAQQLSAIQPLNDTDNVDKKIKEIADLNESLQIIIKEKNELQQYQNQLHLPISSFQEVDNYEKQFKYIQQVWNQKKRWITFYEQNYQQLMSLVDFVEVRGYIEKVLENLIVLEKQLGSNEVVQKIRLMIDNFKPLFQVVEAIREPGIKEKQRMQIRKIIVTHFKGRQIPCGQEEIDNILINIANPKYSFKFFKELEIDKFYDQILVKILEKIPPNIHLNVQPE